MLLPGWDEGGWVDMDKGGQSAERISMHGHPEAVRRILYGFDKR